jgi:hypothetical protein
MERTYTAGLGGGVGGELDIGSDAARLGVDAELLAFGDGEDVVLELLADVLDLLFGVRGSAPHVDPSGLVSLIARQVGAADL